MDYFYCEVRDKCIKPKSKYKHFSSTFHKDFDEFKHIKTNIENPDVNNVDRAVYE